MDIKECSEILKAREKRDLIYYKAFIQLYKLFYKASLDRAYEIASGDLMRSDSFDQDIDTLIDAYFELKEESNLH